ncbi:L,D-transpeptidase family protein [Danxiaibacter flavus]|uniref:L,D-transpeptidase family protein n=1 Tax=Danxiaibacter flavus TaxID=3049108 RepID=A0ABV3ZFA7_9BACT|nr:L,D-transpeptidase family protein [Chitinophagaceae bacterium DXS]
MKNVSSRITNFTASQFIKVVTILIFISCNGQTSNKQQQHPKAKTTHTDSLIIGNFNPASGIPLDSTRISGFVAGRPLFKEFTPDIYKFYSSNHYNYVWYDKKGLSELSNILIGRLMKTDEDGITDTIPYKEDFLKLIHYNDTSGLKNDSAPDITTELMLTAQYFNYAKNIWGGKLNNQAENLNWYLPRKKLSYPELLEKNLTAGAMTPDTNNIVIVQYRGLKDALQRYRDIEKQNAAVTIPSLKKPATLKLNDTSTTITLIRQQLTLYGYAGALPGGNKFDTALATAVNKFRVTHGLKKSAVIDNSLIKEMNVPVTKRIEQIIVNMERLRWIPADSISDEFILVNIPAFTLSYYEDKKIAWGCNVVVGTPMNKTVIFSGMMQYVVFSPYWYVPPSIIRKEILPGMKRNSNYLANHRMEWNGGNVRQKPGKNNSLGLVKFLFPNANNIYLHDTPSKSLFGEDKRAFSHGCVRVSEPRQLAIRLLRYDSSWTPEKIDKAMNAGTEKYVTLKKKIPVYIGYFTCFMDANGMVNFRDDVYKRDDRLMEMLVK